MHTGKLRPFIPLVLLMACLGMLLNGERLRAQPPTIQINELVAITPQNAHQIQYLDTLGLYGSVREISWRDNQTLAVGSATGVRVYDTQQLEATPQLETPDFVHSRFRSPDGSLYYSAGQPSLTFFDAQTHEALNAFYTVKTGWTLSPTWDRLALFNANYGGDWLSIKDVLSGDTLFESRDATSAVAFSRDGSWLAAAHETTVRLIDCAACQQTTLHSTLTPQGTSYASLKFSPDESLLALIASDINNTTSDYLVVVWDVVSGEERMAYRLADQSLKNFAFTPDGSTLVVLTEKLSLNQFQMHVWTLADIGETSAPRSSHAIPYTESRADFYIYPLFNATGTRMALLTSGATVPIWDISGTPETWHLLGELPESNGRQVGAFSPDGTRFAYAASDGRVHVVSIEGDAATWATDDAINGYLAINGRMMVAPDGQLVAWAQGFQACQVRLWDVEARELNAIVFDHCLQGRGQNYIRDMAFSPDSTQFLTLNTANHARLWDVATGALLDEFNLPLPPEQEINYQARAVFGADGEPHIIAQNEQGVVLDITPDAENVIPNTLDFDMVVSDGQYLATLDNNDLGLLRVWDMSDATRRWHAQYDGVMIQGVALSSDSQYVAIGGFYGDDPTLLSAAPIGFTGVVLETRSITSGDVAMTFSGHAFGVRKVVFSPDNQLLVSSSSDLTTRIWDVATGRELMLIRDDSVLDFVAENRVLVTIQDDGLRLYGILR